MKKNLFRVVAVIMMLVMTVGFWGCDKKDTEIENLLTEFEYACNALDFDAALNCIDPRVSDKIKVATNIIGIFTSQDREMLFEKLADLIADTSEINGLEFFESIQIDLQEVIDDEGYKFIKYAFVYVTYEFAGEEITKEAYFSFEKYVDKWYITSFRFG